MEAVEAEIAAENSVNSTEKPEKPPNNSEKSPKKKGRPKKEPGAPKAPYTRRKVSIGATDVVPIPARAPAPAPASTQRLLIAERAAAVDSRRQMLRGLAALGIRK